jgi:uncharacterized membrane-anchored protein YjiN (DUF445 family)
MALLIKENETEAPGFFVKHKGEISFAAALSGLILSSLFLSYSPQEFLAYALILQTGFEAGTVGGAADWLAVKMIFDEIRIGKARIVPASGIIPRKQKAIAQGAGRLVSEEWLSPESINRMLASVDVAGALASYIEKIRSNGELNRYISWLLDHFTALIEKPETREKMAGLLKEQFSKAPWSRWIGENVSDENVKKIVDHAVPFFAKKLTELLSTREAFDLVVEKLSEEKGGFLKQLFFDPVETAEKTILKSIQFLRELQDNPYHSLRLKIDEKAIDWLGELRTNSSSAESLDEFIHEVAEETDYNDFVDMISRKVTALLREQRNQNDGFIYRQVKQWADDIIDGLRNNSEWKKILNEKTLTVIGEIINRNHHLIGEMVEKNLSSLSPDQIKEQFRARTYGDMQWIRVNGAVAGFVIGLVIGVIRVILS